MLTFGCGVGSACGAGESAGGAESARYLNASNTTSPMPSAMLEQDAQTLGLRDKPWSFSGMGSPQQMQIFGFMDIFPPLANAAQKNLAGICSTNYSGSAWTQLNSPR